MSETMLPPNHVNQDVRGIKPPPMPDFGRSLENASLSSTPEGATMPAKKGAGPMDPKAWEAVRIKERGCFAADAVLRVDSIVPGAADEHGRPLMRLEDDPENIEASKALLGAAVRDLLSSNPAFAHGRSADEIVEELMELGFNGRILRLKAGAPAIKNLEPADAEKFYQKVLGEVRGELEKRIPEA